MTRRILIELALFLIPFAVFLFYRIASRELRVRDRWPLTTLVVTGGVLAVGVFVLEPLLSPSDKGKCYIAARYEKGVTIPAKLVDCKLLQPNAKDGSGATATPASTSTEPAPVAPRDETPTPSGIPTQRNEKLIPPGIPAPATGDQPPAPPPPQPLLPPPSGGPH